MVLIAITFIITFSLFHHMPLNFDFAAISIHIQLRFTIALERQ
jgi:hypothetical protein